MLNHKKNAKMILDVIKKAWKTESHIIEWDEEESTSMNEDPIGAEIVKIEKVDNLDGTFKWNICES